MESMPLMTVSPRAKVLISVCCIFAVLTVFFVSLRFVRNVKIRRFSYEDGLILIATLLLLAADGILIYSGFNGNGTHIYEIPTEMIVDSIYYPWLAQPIYAFALMFAKFSVGVILIQLGLGTKFNCVIFFVMFLSAVGNLWTAVVIVAQCNPFSPASHSSGGACFAATAAVASAYFQAAVNIVADVVFFVAPEVALRNVPLSRRDRLAIRSLLAFMFTATVMSICKVVYIKTLLESQDVTFVEVPVDDFVVLEISLSIMAACLPSLRQLFGKRFPKTWQFWKRTATSDNSATYASGSGQQRQPSPDSRKPRPKRISSLDNIMQMQDLESQSSSASRSHKKGSGSVSETAMLDDSAQMARLSDGRDDGRMKDGGYF